MEWFVQLHKKICEWEWYTDIPTCKLFFHILLKCNYKEAKWRGIEVKPGDFITSFDHLAKETWLSIRQVRTALEHLETTWEVTKQSTSQYTILTLTNWGTYNIRDDKPSTNGWQTNDKPSTITNKYNKEKKEKKEIDTTLIFQDHIKTDTESITSLSIKYFLLLWWIPAKDETIDTFRNWIKETFEANGIKDPNKMKYPLDTWYMYWKEQKKSKNLKNTFATTIKFSLPKN